MPGLRLLACVVCFAILVSPAHADTTRIKDLGRFLGWRTNALVGYGVVTGLAGSGDSPRSEVTQQALKNVLSRFGASVSPDQVRSRNVAVVMVMATLPPAASVGDRIDVTVSSVGDARSLLGGTLLMTPLLAADQHPYAMAQGPLVVGGYRFDADFNREQRNHPTAGIVPQGATIEAAVGANLVDQRGDLSFVLNDPDVTTAQRIAEAINGSVGQNVASVQDAHAVLIHNIGGQPDFYRWVAMIENLAVEPDGLARVVVNERSGTIVAGGGVQISSVVVSQGDIRVSVSVDNQGLQPSLYGGYGADVRSLIVSNTKLDVTRRRDAVVRLPNTTVADLIEGLERVHVDTRGMIAVLQAMKAAGALHAEIVVQ